MQWEPRHDRASEFGDVVRIGRGDVVSHDEELDDEVVALRLLIHAVFAVFARCQPMYQLIRIAIQLSVPNKLASFDAAKGARLQHEVVL